MTIGSPEWKKSNSQTFDRVAEAYDRYRPGYPDALFSELISTTRLPAAGKILDVGSGTGKAALPLARRGYSIHCLDTGQNLIEVARRKLSFNPQVTFEVADFNIWQEPESAYNLVISAQAWHWIDPHIGYAKAARALKMDGSLALFWNKSVVSDTPVSQAVQKVYLEVVPSLQAGASYSEEEIAQTKAEIEASGFFREVQVRRYPWSQRYSVDEYLGLLNTFSDHILLPEANRQKLYAGINQAIRSHGGYVDRPVIAVAFLAKKDDIPLRNPGRRQESRRI